jgi:hypothetical protein
MSKCISCGKSLGFFSFQNKCEECKIADKKYEDEQKERKRNEALKGYTSVKSSKDLPVIDPDRSHTPPGVPVIVLKKDEKIHAAALVYVCEYRKDRQFEYGSHGISLRLMKGVSYRVGSGRGHIISNDILVKTGGGILMITNKRVILHPMTVEDKPISIKISDIESYAITEQALTIFKAGKVRPIIFQFYNNSSGAIDDVFGITLSTLLNEL